MTNRRERRAALGALGRVGRAELNELKGITETDPAKLELIAKEYDRKGMRVASQGVRHAIRTLTKAREE